MCKGKGQGTFHKLDVNEVQFGSSKKYVKVAVRLPLDAGWSQEGR